MPRELLTPADASLQEIKDRVRDVHVCIIIPPSPFLADERVFPFLGPLKVAAELRNNGNPVDVLDLSGFANYPEIVREYLTSHHPDVIGLTATTPQVPSAVNVLKAAKEISPHTPVILGGPHATLTHTGMSQDLKHHREGRGTHAFSQLEIFDKVVVGDGEQAVFVAIDPLNRERVVDAGNIRSPLFLQRGSLENYAYPARDLISMDSYHYQIDGHRAFSVIAQLGCPFECGFCGGRDSQIFRVARTRSVDDVVNEIGKVVANSQARTPDDPYTAVMFYDDELNVVPKNLEQLCHGLIDLQSRLGLEMWFRGFVKAELFTAQQSELMYRAGFRTLLSGVESGNRQILDSMQKHTTPKINSECLAMAQNAGLKFKALMSIGHPGESDRTVADSVDWVLTNQPDEVDWTIITQYPGSPYFDRSVYAPGQDAWLYTAPNGEHLWSRDVNFLEKAEYYKGVPEHYVAYVWTDHLASEQLVTLRDQAEAVTRAALHLPPILAVAAMQFDHSMGQGLGPHILRSSHP